MDNGFNRSQPTLSIPHPNYLSEAMSQAEVFHWRSKLLPPILHLDYRPTILS